MDQKNLSQITKHRFPTLLFLIASLLTACGVLNPTTSPSPSPSMTPAPTVTRQSTNTPTPTETIVQGTVTLWHSWDESEVPALVQVIASFQALYPDVLFDVLYVPVEDLRARYEKEVREGGGPTLMLGPADWGPGLYDDGYVADLTDLVKSDLLETLNSAALGAVRYEDALIGMPYSLHGIVLYRNEDIISISPDTFEDLVSLATSATQGETVGAFLERSFFYAGAHLDGIGGQLMDEDGFPTFNDEKGVEWLELLLKFEQAGPTAYFDDQDLEAFQMGRVGWIIDGTWNLRLLAETIGPENLSIDPWPAYEDGYLSGYVQADNLYLSPRAGGDHGIASWKFVEYFLSAEGQTILAGFGHVPSASGVIMTDPIYGPLITQAMAALAGGITYPVIQEMGVYFIPMDAILRGVFGEGAPPADALQAAHDAVLVGITEMHTTPTPAP